jgi:hypothetical protein
MGSALEITSKGLSLHVQLSELHLSPDYFNVAFEALKLDNCCLSRD